MIKIIEEKANVTMEAEFNCKETLNQRNILMEAFEVTPLSGEKLEEFWGIVHLYDAIIDQMYDQGAIELVDDDK